MCETFKLPILYIDHHSISSNVSNDLELIDRNANKSNPCMYDYLLQPSHIFAKKNIDEWSKIFTSNIEYLENTQKIIEEYEPFDSNIGVPNYENINDIWREIQEDKDFIDRFGYMEWDILKQFNESSSFLQTFSCIQIISPILSLLMPLFILFFPFLLLTIQGQEITFDVYVQTLKTIAKNHFIGKLLNISSLNAQNIAYLVISIMFFLFSTYQNIIASIKFYNNIKTMNNNLVALKKYFHFVCPRIETFVRLHREKTQYTIFCDVSLEHCKKIKEIILLLESVFPFSHSMGTLNNIGEMLTIYYMLHENTSFKNSIEYSFGFEGYLDNIQGLSRHIHSKNISFSQFSNLEPTTIEKQYYPSLLGKNPVENDISLKKNIIITGPNASGKTTMLKTTTINIIFSQQFGCGFYKSAIIQPYTSIHSYLNIPDTSERDSLFQAESRRCKDILDAVKDSTNDSHHLCIFDELYSGTNYKDATKSATSFLKYLSKQKNVDYLLTTHYTRVCKNLKKEKRIALFKMDVDVSERGKFEYTYKMKLGVSEIEGAVKILREMNYPEEIIDGIQ